MSKEQRLSAILERFIAVTNDLRDGLRDAGADDNGVLNFFAQAYAIAGIEAKADPSLLVRILAIHSVGLCHMVEDPEISEADLRERLQRELKLTPEELQEAIRCTVNDEQLPLILASVPGEA